MKSKKSFYFEDYVESEFIDNFKNNDIAKVSLNRVIFLFCIFFCLILIFSIKITYLSLSSEKNIYINHNKSSFVNKRRDIVDRNGSVVATNVNLFDVGVRPQLLKDKEKFIIKLRLLFPELNSNKI